MTIKNTIPFFFTLLLLASCKLKSQENKKNKFKNITIQKIDNAVLASGELYRIDSFPSKNIKPRPVDIWLPENYTSEKTYAVLYMHDGQNLFDATTTWNKQEWMIDEVASQLMNENKTRDFIVIGIHNIPQIRFLDLYPEKTFNYIPDKKLDSLELAAKKNGITLKQFTGDEYLKFIVNELKPFIDTTYSVKADKENTFIAGSSMGGLMSWYAISEYPKIFGGAACLSTHWVGLTPSASNPLPDAIFKYLKKNAPEQDTHKLYFDYGNKTLDQLYPQYASRVDTIFLEKGYTTKNFKNLFFDGTDHSEKSWQKRVHIPITFLLKK